MFALLPQSVRRSTLARLLRAFFIFALIVSNLLLPPDVVAQAAAADAPRAQAPVESPSAEPPPPVPLYSPSFAPLGEPAAIRFTVDDVRFTSEEADDAGIVNRTSEIVTLSFLNAAGAAEQPAGAAVELLPAAQASALSPVGVAFRLPESPSSEPQALASGTLQVHIDYAQLAQAYGGSFAERLTLYRVTPCAEESEDSCQNWQELAGVNDLAAQRLTVDLSASVQSAAWSPQPLPPDEGAAPPPADDPTLTQRSYLPLIAAGAAPPVEEELYVLAAAASSQQGSYKATPLTNVGDHQVSLATGAFQTSYPIALPPAAGGLAPSVALSYDSGGVDGMTTNKNTQPGWVGLGWNLESGFVTRHLKTCGVSQAPGDLCLVGGYASTGDAYSIVLNGVASRLVQVSGNLYRLQNDPQWKVEKFSDGASGHPDAQKEYWLVTTPDGTKYRFGGEFTPANEGGQDQNSVSYATVYNTNAAVCGSFSYDLCNKAWRWNLDRVEDANGNVVSSFYELETNFYAARNDTRTLFRKEYVRAGNLSRIEYGRRVGVNSTPPTQVIFSTEERCEGACVWPTNYPDTPGDLVCGASGSCSQNAPTFWSRKRLATITTQLFDQNTSSWTNVSRFDLAYSFPTPPNDGQGDASEKKLWLSSITQRLGDGSGGLPATNFGYTMLANRWDHNAAGVSPLTMPRVSQLTTQLGGVVSVSYGQSHPCPGGGSYIRYPYDCFPAWFTNGSSSGWTLWNKWKVTQQSSSDSFSGNATQTLSFSYSAPTWHYSDDPALPDINSCTLCPTRHWNDFRGSEIVTVTDAAGAKSEHRFHRGMNGDRLGTAGGVFSASTTLSDGGTRPDENWLRGQEVEARRLTSVGVARSRSVNWFTWTLTAGSGASGAYWLGTQKNESTLYATTTKTSRTEFVYDGYGNVTRQILHGDTATSADDRNIERSYLTNSAAWIVDRPQWEKLWAGVGSGSAGSEQAYSQFAYDSLGFGAAPLKGNLSNLRSYWQMTPSSQYAETSTVYDTFGRPTSVTDARGKTTSTTYHPFYGYATSMTNALGHVVSTVSDPAWGVPTQITDANSKLTELETDGYGRLRKVWLPSENKASEPASLEFVYDAAARPAWVQSRTLRVKGSAAYLESWQYVDGFGRPLQSQTPSAASGQRIVSSQQTNALGQLLHQSAPYALSGAAGSGYVAPLWSTVANYQRFAYDELGNQTLSETKSQSSVLWSNSALYDGWQRQATDANGRRRDFEQNAFGQLVKVTEYTTGNIAQLTNYMYDLRGGLTGVTDALGNVTSMSYDLLGRKTAMSDPDMGSWLYQYDANGNLTGQRDARGLWLYLGYDDLNRLTTRRQDNPTSGALVAEYLYDAVGQKGLLSKSRSYTAEGVMEVQNLAYDARNRPTQQQWTVPGVGGGTFRMDAAFDEAGQKTSLTYPGGSAGQSGEVVSYQYNAVGQLVSVSGLGGIQYVSSASYNAQGQITQLVNENGNGANGLTRQWSYETNTLRLSVVQAGTAAPFENLQKLSYAYDNAGNITTLTDGTNSNQTQSFGYDWLNRLTGASTNAAGVGQYDHTYSYDAVGNITNFAGAAYTYGDPAHKHAVTAAFGNTYGYDANGNQTSRTIGGVTYSFSYDYENRLTSISGAGVSATFLYDADGQRVKGTVNGVATVYVAGVYEWQGGATTLYYEGNAIRRSGYATGNGVFYLLQDHLKSSSAFVTQDGVINSRNYFYPFGGNRGGTAFSELSTKRFTGQYHESALPGGEGLSYYGARWYDAQLGRFLSADTIVPGPANPQAFNRYSYVLNSPTGLVDASGHFPIRDDGGRTRKTAGLGAGATGDAAGRAWLHRSVYNHWQPVLRSLPQNGSIKEFFASAVIKDARKLGVGYTTERVFHPTSNDVTLALTTTLNEASNSPMVTAMRDVQRYDGLMGFIAANAMWTSLVGTGAIWDFKQDITPKIAPKGTVVIGKQRLNFQAVANIAFGYLGDRAGFSPTWLHFGAGIAQLEHGAAHWQGNLQVAPQYFGDQEFDGWAVGFGFYLSERYATMPLTPAMVTVAMTDYVAMYPIPEGP